MTPRRTLVTLGVRISVDQKEDLKVRLSHWSTGCTLMKFSEADLHVWVLDQVPLGLSCPGLSPDSRWVRGEQRGWESWAHLRVCYPCFLLCQNSANELSKQALTNTFSSAHRCWRKRLRPVHHDPKPALCVVRGALCVEHGPTCEARYQPMDIHVWMDGEKTQVNTGRI